MSAAPDVSVLIPTHNRATDLRRTLEGMAACERGELDVELVVIASACRDDTASVAKAMGERTRVRFLDEPEPGKNRALNRALEEVELAPLVVLTDDDVDPAPDWFTQIADVSARWPDHDVFGGKIHVVWPEGDVPDWARDPYVQEFGFTAHDYSEEECLYREPRMPFGPNHWVRASVFEGGRRFDERIGPHPTNRIMGSETSFLRGLRDDGYAMVYSPKPEVGHRIQPDILTARRIRRRAYTLGRGIPHGHGLPREELLGRNPLAWRLLRAGLVARDALRLAGAQLSLSSTSRVLSSIHVMRDLGYNTECLRIARHLE